jgi:hypothetical protein
MRVEIMHLNNGIGSSTAILTGANVFDIVPSEYDVLYRINSGLSLIFFRQL